MLEYKIKALSSKRLPFTDAFPASKEAHREVQKALFGAIRTAKLPNNELSKDLMLKGWNQLLGLELTSRKQATIEEMELVIVAVESGAFNSLWELADGVKAHAEVKTVQHLSVEPPKPKVLYVQSRECADIPDWLRQLI